MWLWLQKAQNGLKRSQQGDKFARAYQEALFQASELVLHRMRRFFPSRFLLGPCVCCTDHSCRPFLHSDFLFARSEVGRRFAETTKLLHDFTRCVLEQRKREIAEGTRPARPFRDFLSILLEVLAQYFDMHIHTHTHAILSINSLRHRLRMRTGRSFRRRRSAPRPTPSCSKGTLPSPYLPKKQYLLRSVYGVL
jgi:hypothetical protein